ncbi:hypothetical protein J1605_009234 [Eschrichtius robustus]|uniref:Complexin-1 n=1 Tax=Eschrichtius robustus TaxID=9764 RepID=A0AB34GYN7_ESCRO|nr:hypothetical protein J1605_009234 [Eschrichtius robustus]
MGDLPRNTPGQLGPTWFPPALRQEVFPVSHGRMTAGSHAIRALFIREGWETLFGFRAQEELISILTLIISAKTLFPNKYGIKKKEEREAEAQAAMEANSEGSLTRPKKAIPPGCGDEPEEEEESILDTVIKYLPGPLQDIFKK